MSSRRSVGVCLVALLGAACASCESSPAEGGNGGQGGHPTTGSNTGNAGGGCLTTAEIMGAGYTGSVCAVDNLKYWDWGVALDAGVCILHCWTGPDPGWTVCPDTPGAYCGIACTGPGQCPAGSYCDMKREWASPNCEAIPGYGPYCTVPTTDADACLHSGLFKTCPGVGGQGAGGQAGASGGCIDGCVALRAERPYYRHASWFQQCGGGGGGG